MKYLNIFLNFKIMIIKDIEKTDMRRFGVLTQLNVPL